MSFQTKNRRAPLMVLCFGIVLALACKLTQVTPTTQIVEVTQIIPVTQFIQSTQIVKVTRIVSIPQTVEVRSKTPKEGLYFSAGDNLYHLNLDGSDFELVTNCLGTGERLAIDLPHNKIYMSRWDGPSQISVFDLQSGQCLNTFFDGPGSGGQGLAVDPTTSKIYLGLYYNGVYVMDMNNVGAWTQLVDSGSLSPLLGQRGELQIDTTHHQIYFRTAFNGDCGLCRYIWRVDFDGNNLMKIIPADGGDGLALDLTAQKMYFSDVPGNGTIKRANLDGSRLETIFTVPAPYSFCRSLALDVAGKKMYMMLTDENNGFKGMAITRANMDGTGFEILFEKTGQTAEEVVGSIILFLP